MAKSAVLTMISGAIAPAISNVFVNNKSESLTLQITGTFSTATVLVEGLVNTDSTAWTTFATFNLTDLSLTDAEGIENKGIYTANIVGVLRVRIHVTEVSGGDITVAVNFVGDTVSAGVASAPSANLVPITAYDMAVAGGYTGTKAQFETDMGNSATNATIASEAAASAYTSALNSENAAASYLMDTIGIMDSRTVEWSQGGISSDTGGTQPSTNPNYPYRVKTNSYQYAQMGIKVVIPTGKSAYWYQYSTQSIDNYEGNSGAWLEGTVLLKSGYYYKLAVRFNDNGAIGPSDVSEIRFEFFAETDTTLTMANKAADAKKVGDDLGAVERGLINNVDDFIDGKELKSKLSVNGSIHIEDGTDWSTSAISSSYRRTDYLYFPKGTKLVIQNMYAATSVAIIAIYNTQKVYDSSNSIAGGGTTYAKSRDVIMPYDGFVRISTLYAEIDSASIKNQSGKKTLNILVFGNSFAQDSWAYVPPILNELLPEYAITYCDGYIGSTGIKDHINAYKNNSIYTWVNVWYPLATKWERTAKNESVTPPTGKKFSDIIAICDHWDIVYVQGHGNVTNLDTFIANNIVTGREFLRILQKEIPNPFAYLTGRWLATGTEEEEVFGASVFAAMTNCMNYFSANLGVNDVIQIGTAIQNARTNSVFDDLGHYGDVNVGTEDDPVWVHENPGHLLYNNHQQSGIPALLSAYMIVLSLLKLVGKQATSIYKSSFVPTTANCVAINAYKAAGMTKPFPMTHGDSVGVEDGSGNILWDNVRAAQEIAVLAHNNPNVITDCADIIVSAD